MPGPGTKIFQSSAALVHQFMRPSNNSRQTLLHWRACRDLRFDSIKLHQHSDDTLEQGVMQLTGNATSFFQSFVKSVVQMRCHLDTRTLCITITVATSA